MLVSDVLGSIEFMGLLIQAEQQLGRTINPTLYPSKEFEGRVIERQTFLTRVLAQHPLGLHGESTFNQRSPAYLATE